MPASLATSVAAALTDVSDSSAALHTRVAHAGARWRSSSEPLKLLDIRNGLPCNDVRTKELQRRYPHAEVWSATSEASASFCGADTLVGDLAKALPPGHDWAAKVGGGFDLLLDVLHDADDARDSVPTRLMWGWQNLLRPGGRYILEHVGDGPIVDAMQDHLEWLIVRATTCMWETGPEGPTCARHLQARARKSSAQPIVYSSPPGLQYVVALPRSIVLKKAVAGFFKPGVEKYWEFARRKQPERLTPATTGEDVCIADFNRSAYAVAAARGRAWFDARRHREGVTATDKVWRHYYQVLYGSNLCDAQRRHMRPAELARDDIRWRRPSKMLEIGLGCDMQYGPGMSVPLWEDLFPATERWEAEVNAACVKQSQAKGELQNISVVTGDQGNLNTLAAWKVRFGGHLDVIIDDGSHLNRDILRTFEQLWPELNPGGIYVAEDIHLGRTTVYDNTKGAAIVSDFVQHLAKRVLLGGRLNSARNSSITRRVIDPHLANVSNVVASYVFCSLEACAIGKPGSAKW